MASRVLGVDSGGTFTDLVFWEDGEVRTHKRPSTPEDPSLAILAGIKEAGLTPDELVPGSTVARNTILQGSGARAACAPRAVTEVQQAADESLCTAYPGVIRENMSPDVEVPNNM